MNEAMRFIRYSLPGLSTILTIVGALLISGDQRATQFLSSVLKGDALGSSVAMLLLSAGLGYLLAQVYFAIAWHPGFDKRFAVNHLDILRKLVKNGKVRIVNALGDDIIVNDRRTAWEIMALYGTTHISKDQDTYEKLMERLVNIVHGLGATIVGILVASVIWIAVYYSAEGQSLCINITPQIITAVTLLFFIYTLCFTHSKAKRSAERIANSRFAQNVCNANESGRKVTIVYEAP